MEQREINGAKFDGYVTAKLEDIGKVLDKMDKKLDLLDSCVNGMKVKVAAIGGTVSLIVTVLVLILSNLVSK